MILTFSKNFELRTSLNHWVVLTFAVDLMKESHWGCYTMLPEAILFYMYWKALGTKRNVQKAPVKPSSFSHSHFLVLKAFGGSLLLLNGPQRSYGQGYVFTRVCDSVHRGVRHPPRRRHHPWETPPMKEAPPCQGDPPEGGTPLGRRPPCQGGTTLGRRSPSRPTPKGEIEGDQVQAHTQGGNWEGIRSRPTPKGEIEGGSDPGPHPRGKLRGSDPGPHPRGKLRGDQIQAHTQGGNWGGIRSRPTPKGEIEGIRSRPTPKGEIEGHTQEGNWGGSDPGPHPRGKLRGTPKGEIEGDQIQAPPKKQTPAYGQWAAGTHPTGMHSCFFVLINLWSDNMLLLVNRSTFFLKTFAENTDN